MYKGEIKMREILLCVFILNSITYAIEIGEIPPHVVIGGEDGAKVDGTSWDSAMLNGKIHTFFYVDPDKKDLNNALADALKAKRFDREKVNSVAVVNLAATWLPNAIIESKLKEKQKKYPHTIYVKDKKKVLVKKWNLEDDNSDILIFDKKGKVIYKKFGKVSDNEIHKVIRLIEDNI